MVFSIVGAPSDMGDARTGADWKQKANVAMDRYACGDDAAFGELYDLLAPRLHAFLCRRVRDESFAEDLLQQTFLQMHAARRHFCQGAEVMPWAFAIARRLLIDSVRRVGHNRIPASDGDPAAVLDERPSPESSPASRAGARVASCDGSRRSWSESRRRTAKPSSS